jgi:hypothetical protein
MSQIQFRAETYNSFPLTVCRGRPTTTRFLILTDPLLVALGVRLSEYHFLPEIPVIWVEYRSC